MESISIGLPAETLEVLTRLATNEDISVGQVVRNAIARDLSRRRKARKPVRADERLVAPLRALLAEDFAYSATWDELQTRLRRKGFQLHAAGGGLALHCARTGSRICKSSELGNSYSQLLRRINRPFPGHSHVTTFRRVQAGTQKHDFVSHTSLLQK